MSKKKYGCISKLEKQGQPTPSACRARRYPLHMLERISRLESTGVSSPTSLAAVLGQGFNLLEGLCRRRSSCLGDSSLQDSLVSHQGSNLQQKTTNLCECIL